MDIHNTSHKPDPFPKTLNLNSANPREIAYLALLSSLREESFLDEFLENLNVDLQNKLPSRDFQFCRALAYGTLQMALALDYLAKQLSDKKALKLKLKELIILRLALYQYYFMDKVPLYAIANEMGALAKKYTSIYFANFLNALLRKLEKTSPKLPKGNSIEELSILYSYPISYVNELIKDYGAEVAEIIMIAGNRPSPTIIRVRDLPNQNPNEIETKTKHLSILSTEVFTMAELNSIHELTHFANSQQYYIQNITPALLIGRLSTFFHNKGIRPNTILDLCASPGGKLLALHDLYQDSQLFANDISEAKLLTLKENIKKYNLKVTLSCSKGELFDSRGMYFDLIVLDVPCSNTGVLNKRPEARWRQNEESWNNLEKVQLGLIERAVQLLNNQSYIFYMTCSILKRENEDLIEKACNKFNLKWCWQETILPRLHGWDGGYGCILEKRTS